MFIEYLVNNEKQPPYLFLHYGSQWVLARKKMFSVKITKKTKTLTLHTIEPLEYDQA